MPNWKLIYRDERGIGTPGPALIECYRREGDGIMVSLDLRRQTDRRWNWARTYHDERGRISFVRGYARNRADAVRDAKGVAP